MLNKIISVVHRINHTGNHIISHLDSPKHREQFDFSNDITLTGWATSLDKNTKITLHYRTNHSQGLIKICLPRPDVATHYSSNHNISVGAYCGFNTSIQTTDDITIFAKCSNGNTYDLYSISMIKTDSIAYGFEDKDFCHPEIPSPKLIPHSNFWNYLTSKFNTEEMTILEIGSRSVTSNTPGNSGKAKFPRASYTGFDYYEGNNVDIVGDAHNLSSYFNYQFDLIISFAVFEHLAMPWIVAKEISKLLKIGGIAAIETHFSYSSHERPWHFFQFSDLGLRSLFSRKLGFECLDSGMSNPIVGRFSSLADKYLQNKPVTGLYCHSEILVKKVSEPSEHPWSSDDIQFIVNNTVYPKPRND